MRYEDFERAADIVAELVAALERLARETGGMLEMARECVGNTNVAVLQKRIEEARSALARTEEPHD